MTGKIASAVFCVALFIVICGGCSNDALDPTQIGRFRPIPKVNVILDSLGVADEPDPIYSGAEEPRPEDVIAVDEDYKFGQGDIVRVSVYELRREGTIYQQDFVVTETGKISIPEVGLVRAEGLTESELEAEIRDILSPSILLDPSVSVALLQSQGRQFSIFGNGVGNPGRYAIPRYDYRLTEAITTAGGVAEFNLSYIYVTRHVTGEGDLYFPETAESRKIDEKSLGLRIISPEDYQLPQGEREMLEMISRYAKGNTKNGIIIYSSEMASDAELRALAAPEGVDVENGTSESAGQNNGNGGGRIEWVFRDGKWVPIQTGGKPRERQTRPIEESFETRGPDVFPEDLEEEGAGQIGWEDIGTAGKQVRVIKIPVDKLLGGDPRYNIVIKAGDAISVPVDLIGEFWVMGNVNAQGPVSLTGRPMTLKMAIASAGGLGPLAWPQKVEVVRRIGKNKEEYVMVDLEKIAKGQQPDFFVKPYDLINVGTHGVSRWLAVLRNAFRATYGFGFVYDRNFATEDLGNRPFPGSITWDDFASIF